MWGNLPLSKIKANLSTIDDADLHGFLKLRFTILRASQAGQYLRGR